MKALILNSGRGKRMGSITNNQPKCMSKISTKDTILSRQLELLNEFDINEVVITTGHFDKILIDYCNGLNLSLKKVFVNNPAFDKTNYIYSIYLAREFLKDDILLLHGDLVFEKSVLKDVLEQSGSCMALSSTIPLPNKDFKAVLEDGFIKKVGIDFFENALTAQPLYKLNQFDWLIWLNNIVEYCEKDKVNCYAENALNEVTDRCRIQIMDYKDRLCLEVDTLKDLQDISAKFTNTI